MDNFLLKLQVAASDDVDATLESLIAEFSKVIVEVSGRSPISGRRSCWNRARRA